MLVKYFKVYAFVELSHRIWSQSIRCIGILNSRYYGASVLHYCEDLRYTSLLYHAVGFITYSTSAPKRDVELNTALQLIWNRLSVLCTKVLNPPSRNFPYCRNPGCNITTDDHREDYERIRTIRTVFVVSFSYMILGRQKIDMYFSLEKYGSPETYPHKEEIWLSFKNIYLAYILGKYVINFYHFSRDLRW